MKRWRLRHLGADLQIEVGFAVPSNTKDLERSRREVDALLWRGLTARDAEVRRVLDAIYRELRGNPTPSGGPETYGPDFEHSLAADVRFAAHSGRLRVARVEPTPGPARSAVTPGNEAVLGPEREPDAWIAIELVDEDGKPVPNVDYRIKCDDGRVRTGTTNADGKARVEGLHDGNCAVSFPHLHGPDWKKAG
jgi:hypothetical protein